MTHSSRKGKPGPFPGVFQPDYTPAQIERGIARGRRLLLDALKQTDDPRVPYEPTLSAIRARTSGYATRYRSITTSQVMHLLSRGEIRFDEFCNMLDTRRILPVVIETQVIAWELRPEAERIRGKKYMAALAELGPAWMEYLRMDVVLSKSSAVSRPIGKQQPPVALQITTSGIPLEKLRTAPGREAVVVGLKQIVYGVIV